MRLLKVELTRLRWRRAVLLLLCAAVLIPVIFIVATAWNTRPVSDGEIADARQEMQQNNAWVAKEVDRCMAHPKRYGFDPDDDLETLCNENMPVDDDVSHYLYRDQLSTPYVIEGAGLSTAVFMTLLALILGTTFAGADWASGSMSNQLLFESRRTRLWGAKAAAATLGGLVLALLGSVVVWGLYAGLAAIRDVPLAGFGDDIGALLVRSVLFAGAAALAGYAITMLFRNTVACLGLVLAGAVGGSMLIAVLPLDDPERWMPHANAAAVLQDGHEYWPQGDYMCSGDCSEITLHLSLAHGVVYFAVLIALVVALSIISFRRRDVP